MELEGVLDLLRLDRPEAPQPWKISAFGF